MSRALGRDLEALHGGLGRVNSKALDKPCKWRKSAAAEKCFRRSEKLTVFVGDGGALRYEFLAGLLDIPLWGVFGEGDDVLLVRGGCDGRRGKEQHDGDGGELHGRSGSKLVVIEVAIIGVEAVVVVEMGCVAARVLYVRVMSKLCAFTRMVEGKTAPVSCSCAEHPQHT